MTNIDSIAARCRGRANAISGARNPCKQKYKSISSDWDEKMSHR